MTDMSKVAIRSAALALAMISAGAGPSLSQDGGASNGAAAEKTSAPSGERLDDLFARLASAEEPQAGVIASDIRAIWAKSGSDSMDLLLRLGHKAVKEGDFPRARARFAALTRLAPDFAEGWNASATLAFIEGDLGRAAGDIENALRLEPRHFSALAGLAMILEHTGRPKAALDVWREVARLYPALGKAQTAIERLTPEVEGLAL